MRDMSEQLTTLRLQDLKKIVPISWIIILMVFSLPLCLSSLLRFSCSSSRLTDRLSLKWPATKNNPFSQQNLFLHPWIAFPLFRPFFVLQLFISGKSIKHSGCMWTTDAGYEKKDLREWEVKDFTIWVTSERTAQSWLFFDPNFYPHMFRA